MANQYKGEIKGSLGDKERTFRLTFESIVSIENRTGKSILDITNSFGNNNYSMRDVVIIMHEALKGAGGTFTQPTVGDMVMKTGLMKVAILCSEVLMTVFVGDKKDEESPLVQGRTSNQVPNPKNT